MIPIFDSKRQYAQIGAEAEKAVCEVMRSGCYILGPNVKALEQELADYIGCKYTVALNSGTDALHIALRALNIGAGDEVITTAFTFVATAQAVAMCGGKPVFCEVDPVTFLIDIEDCKKRITDKTKAIIPVHYAGRPCEMDALMKIKEETGIRIVEDAAHAFGTYYKGRKIGSFGDITCFSFDSIKVMTCGEGGAIVTDDEAFDDLSRKKRLLGIDRKTMHVKDWKKRSWVYDVPTLGYRYHMSNINAAIGLAQIKKVDKFIERRRELCHLYDAELKDVAGIGIMPDEYDTITPFMYVIRVKDGKRNALKDYLMEHDIESGISYIPCHHFSRFKSNDKLPVTDDIYEEVLCLPMHYELSDDDVMEVCGRVKEFMAK